MFAVSEAAADYYWLFEGTSGSTFYAASSTGQPTTNVYLQKGGGGKLYTVPDRVGTVLFCKQQVTNFNAGGRCLTSSWNLPCLR